MKYATPLTTLLICLLATFLSAQSTISKTIYFEYDKHELTADSEKSLQSLAAQLATYSEYSLEVIGHTDQDGSEGYNLLLSQNRAESVRSFLTAQGLTEDEIVVQYYGESLPLQSADHPLLKSENRRVTVQAEVYKYNNVNEMVSQLQTDGVQEHTVSQFVETTITLPQGTEVTVPAEAFCNLDGSPIYSDKVKLICKEVFSYTDMVDQQLFTQTPDRMLETGGMIYLEARLDGEQLRLQDGKSIALKLPEQGTVVGMEVFEGLADSTATIWKETGTKVKIEKEEPFIQIDLSSLFDYVFEDTTNVDLTMGEMPDYPRPLRIAYPPNKNFYTEEEYKEVYRKYEEVMEAHNNDKVDLPQRQEEWHAEAERRTALLKAHKSKYIRARIITKLQELIARMPAVQNTVSHHKLVGSLNSVLDSRVEKIPYDERRFKTAVFRGAMADIKELRTVRFPNYQHTRGLDLLPEFNQIVSALSEEIRAKIWAKDAPARAKKDSIRAIAKAKYDAMMQKRFEDGYVDRAAVGRYILSTSNLGWINCDRFLDLEEFEMTQLQFAKSNYKHAYYLVFKDIRSMLRPTIKGGEVTFKNIPKGEEVRLVSLKFSNGKAQMAYQDFVLGNEEVAGFSYQEVGVSELRAVFEQM